MLYLAFMFYIYDQRDESPLKNFFGRFFHHKFEIATLSIWFIVYTNACLYQVMLSVQDLLYSE